MQIVTLLPFLHKYDFKPYAYGFQKDSPYLSLFNYYLKDMQEKGSLKQILVAYTAQKQVCPDTSGEALNWGACFTAFGVLAFGGMIALVLFLVEFLAGVLRLNVPILAW